MMTVRPSEQWLKTLAMGLSLEDYCAVGGRTVNQLRYNPYSQASQMVVDYLYVAMNENPLKARFLASNNLAVPKDRFMSLGGFDTGFTRAAGEDRDFCRGWVKRGYPMIYTPDAVVYHAHDLSFSGYLQQHFNYGRGAFEYHRRSPKVSLKKLESLSFYMKLLRFPLDQPKIAGKLYLFCLMAISQGATAAGFLAGIRSDTVKNISTTLTS